MKLQDKERILQSVLSTIDDEKLIKKVEALLGVKNFEINDFEYYLKKIGVNVEKGKCSVNSYKFLKSGLREFDRHTSGWKIGSLNIVAAHNGMGISAFLLTIIRNTAVLNNQGIAMFSFDQSSVNYANRIIASETGISSLKLNEKKLEEHEFIHLESKVTPLIEAPIFIDDSFPLTVICVKNKIRKLIKKKGIKLVLIDSLEQIIGQKEQVLEDLNHLARDLKIPIVVVYALPLSWVDGLSTAKRPSSMSFLKKFSRVCYDDFIETLTFIYRPEYYGITKWEDNTSCEGQVELICYGDNFSKKEIRLKYVGHLARFMDL